MTGLWGNVTGNAAAILHSLAMNEARTSLAILMVLALDYLVRQWNPRLRYGLWLLVLCQALWPPTFHIPALTVWSEAPVRLVPIILEPVSNPAAIKSRGVHTPVWLLALWGTATLVVILWMTTAFFSLRWKLRHARPMQDQPSIYTDQTARRSPAVLVSDRIHSPLTIGLIRPRIYLNSAALRMDEAALRAILHHELAHIVRRDRWVICMQVLALILHPFNPLVWIMNRRLARYREQVCDHFALRHSDIAPVRYGHLLLDYVAQGVLCRPALLPRTLFCESRNDLRQRLTQLLSQKETTMNRTSIAQKISLVTILIAMAFISSQCQEDDNALLEQQHNLQAAITDANPPPIPEGNSNLTDKEQKQAQTDLAELGVEFVPYDEHPQPVGGFSAISKMLKYPAAAKAARIDGQVLIICEVLDNGRTGKVFVSKNETGDQSLADAAVAAVRDLTWIPAKQEGESVSVWVTIPIEFSLED